MYLVSENKLSIEYRVWLSEPIHSMISKVSATPCKVYSCKGVNQSNNTQTMTLGTQYSKLTAYITIHLTIHGIKAHKVGIAIFGVDNT